MVMSYRKEEFVKNPIASFMYFIPLIAPTFVDNISSVNNDQQVGIISHELKENSKSFQVTCEFEILGSGFHMSTFCSLYVLNKDNLLPLYGLEQVKRNLFVTVKFRGGSNAGS